MQTTRVLYETCVRFSEGSKLPGKPSKQRLQHYADLGLLCRATGQKIFLEWAKDCNYLVTSVEAYKRFLKRINGEKCE